ncbi:11-beta-hydroxysteroid dehydrogenase A-like [Phoenix dactylifera]|uniref:11-beta-hydroxysteroid dehydrogenase A-like n=1 Tax=Phoenix dactylifera TaxID=42345 RepID=A0A8B9AW89_PHODC|nr:11-beta-hydroxysteroid dehydrogenase A-like [Phoenix dactylifera]
MNIVARPATLIAFFLFFPPSYLSKLFFSFLSSLSPEDMMTHKVVPFTGASSSGVGEHLPYQYAKKEAFLVLVARRERSLTEAAEKARDLGSPDAPVVPIDVSKPDEHRWFIDAAIIYFSRLNHLIVNDPIWTSCLFEEINISAFTQVKESKAAIIRFYEALQSKLHAEIRITVITPGYVASELTKC